MEKELKKEIKLIKKLIEFIDFEKNNEKIIQNLVKYNILNFGDTQNYDKKNC